MVEMDIGTLVLIAVGLAMDALAVSIVKGMTISLNRRRAALTLGAFFGGFQMLMPVVGWYVGAVFEEVISGIDHWIAFGLLAFIGLKMIYDSTKKNIDSKKETLRLHTVLTLAIATSVDALLIGLSFAFMDISIFEPILLIGFVTFLLSVTGFFFGCRLGSIFGSRMKIVGGFILIFIGLRVLLDHIL